MHTFQCYLKHVLPSSFSQLPMARLPSYPSPPQTLLPICHPSSWNRRKSPTLLPCCHITTNCPLVLCESVVCSTSTTASLTATIVLSRIYPCSPLILIPDFSIPPVAVHLDCLILALWLWVVEWRGDILGATPKVALYPVGTITRWWWWAYWGREWGWKTYWWGTIRAPRWSLAKNKSRIFVTPILTRHICLPGRFNSRGSIMWGASLLGVHSPWGRVKQRDSQKLIMMMFCVTPLVTAKWTVSIALEVWGIGMWGMWVIRIEFMLTLHIHTAIRDKHDVQTCRKYKPCVIVRKILDFLLGPDHLRYLYPHYLGSTGGGCVVISSISEVAVVVVVSAALSTLVLQLHMEQSQHFRESEHIFSS